MFLRPGMDKDVPNPFASGQVILQSQLHRRLDLLAVVVPVQHQHGDKILDACRLLLLRLKLRQKPLQGGRPRRSPLPNHPGGIESSRLAPDQLQVVLGIELPFVVAEEPFVRGDLPSFIKEFYPIDGTLTFKLEAGILYRNGVVVFIGHHRSIFIYFRVEDPQVAERSRREA